jgi:hypothetical protein
MDDELKKLKEQLNRMMNAQNNAGIADFEGLSPIHMQFVLYSFFSPECPIQLNLITEADVALIPIMQIATYIIEAIQATKNGELKLTTKGNLPQKLVGEIIDKAGMRELYDEVHYKKINEEDAMPIHFAKILLDLSKIVKKRDNKYSLTKNGEKIIKDPTRFFITLLENYCYQFNWAYYGYDDSEDCARIGFGFSIYLLHKYGDVKREDDFYAEKYLKAFPKILHEFQEKPYGSKANQFQNCYNNRTFNRFMRFFGLAETEQAKLLEPTYVTKTALFDRLVKVKKK